MKVVIQRVSSSSVTIDAKIVAEIKKIDGFSWY
jgi:D-Tyr-tRNAtyr deacylase